MTKRSQLTHDKIIKLHARLSELVESIGDGLCRYKEGDDTSVAREIGCTTANVANMRVRMFGQLRPARVSPDHTQDRIEVLERVVDSLQRRLDRLIADLGGPTPSLRVPYPANGARSAPHE